MVIPLAFDQMVYAQPRICPGECDTQNLRYNKSPNLGQKNRPNDN